MRFLIVTPLVPPEPGGPSYYSVGLEAALKKAGHETDLIAFREVRGLPSGVRHFVFLYKVLLRAVKADVLIVLDTVSVAIPAVLAGWVLGKKIIVRTGGDFVWEQYVERTGEKVLFRDFYTTAHTLSRKEKILVWLQKRVVLRLAPHVVYNTQLQRGVWREAFDVPDTKTSVLENSYPARTEIAAGGANIVCAWRPTAFKNVDMLERAHAQAQERCGAPELALLKGVPREELSYALAHARALVIPSLTEFGPNLALEALSMGVPVVLTKECGLFERLDGHVTWIDPLDADAVASTLCQFVNKQVVADAREKAKAFAMKRTYDDVAADFVALCDTL